MTPLPQILVVYRKELRDWSRDRRSIMTVLISSLLAPVIIGVMFTQLANRQRQVEDVKIPVVGAAHAPALVAWLQQQAGVEVVDGPADPQEAVRTRKEDVVVVIDDEEARHGGHRFASKIRRRSVQAFCVIFFPATSLTSYARALRFSVTRSA